MKNQGQQSTTHNFTFTVCTDYANSRIDSCLASKFPLYSRTFFQQLIEDTGVLVDGKIINKPSVKVKEGHQIAITFPPKKEVEPRNIDIEGLGIELIAQTEHFMIIFKPAGLLMHQPTHTSTHPTVVDWVIQANENMAHVGYADRPGIVHRLDKDTSGVVALARTSYGHLTFGKLFRNRAIKKTYLAVVEGHPPREGTIDRAIVRHPVHRARMAAYHPGLAGSGKVRPAQSTYRVLEYFENASLVEVKPITGRTHQIRVHFASIGHPLLGDVLYGKKSKLIKRQALHAKELSFDFENIEHTFSYDYPEDFKQLITQLRQQTS